MGGRGRGKVTAVWVLAVGLCPAPALAERGALSVEVGLVGGLGSHTAAHASPTTGTTLPGAGLQGTVRHALTHDFEAGLRLGVQPARAVVLERVEVESLTGELHHQLLATHVGLTARWYVAGLNWRVFVEPAAGLELRRQSAFDLVQVRPGEPPRSYGLDLPDVIAPNLVLGLSPGVAYVWDRLALAVTLETSLAVGTAVEWTAGVGGRISWSFYP